MSTPLEVRNRRREAQRTIRLAVNAINNSLDAWKVAIDDGKKHATNLTNEILTAGHLQQLPLAALSDVPGLTQAALLKTSTQIHKHVASLLLSLENLMDAFAALGEAVAPVAALSSEEQEHSILRGSPVFTSFPLHTIASLLQRIESMYSVELERKKVIVQDFQRVSEIAQQRAAADDNDFPTLLKTPPRVLENGVSTSRDIALLFNQRQHRLDGNTNSLLESFLQVHIIAWMLSPEIDEAAVEADLGLIMQDTNSC